MVKYEPMNLQHTLLQWKQQLRASQRPFSGSMGLALVGCLGFCAFDALLLGQTYKPEVVFWVAGWSVVGVALLSSLAWASGMLALLAARFGLVQMLGFLRCQTMRFAQSVVSAAPLERHLPFCHPIADRQAQVTAARLSQLQQHPRVIPISPESHAYHCLSIHYFTSCLSPFRNN